MTETSAFAGGEGYEACEDAVATHPLGACRYNEEHGNIRETERQRQTALRVSQRSSRRMATMCCQWMCFKVVTQGGRANPTLGGRAPGCCPPARFLVTFVREQKSPAGGRIRADT